MNSELFDHLKKFNTNPYLFIGSGLSRRYLNLPTWEQLLQDFCEQSEINGEFEYFQSKANGNLPQIASILSKEFHEVWWKHPKFKSQRNKHKTLAKQHESIALKIELANLIEKSQKVSKIYKTEIELLRNSVVDGIITTNWDSFLESIFTDYEIFIGQQQLLFSESISIGETYKIHGCITKPESLIVTKEDYDDFNSKNAYLAAKLLTIFVEHPVIFIGYSLSDNNVQEIIESIIRCVEFENLDKLKDRLIFIEWKEGADFEIMDSSMKLSDNKVLPIKLIRCDSFESVFETLSKLKRKIPVQILRKLKNSVVEFVKSTDPTTNIFVQDIDLIDAHSNIEYAIGVGVATQLLSTQGYKPIETIDIIEDILNDNKNFDSKQLIENTFPKIAKGNSYIPMFKYLDKEGFINKNGSLSASGLAKISGQFVVKKDIPNCFVPTGHYFKKQAEIRRNHKSVLSISQSFDKPHSLNYVPLLNSKNIDLSQLQVFLRACLKDEETNTSTAFRKLVCYYDYLKYGLRNN